MLGVVGGEALDVFNPEEVVPVVRFAQVHGDGPGGGQQDRAQDGQRPEAHQLEQAALIDDVGHDDHHGHRQGDEALGEKTHAAGEAEQQITTDPAAKGALLADDVEADHGVQQAVGADAVDDQQRQIDEPGQEGLAPALPQLQGKPADQQGAQTGGGGRGEAHGEVGVTEQLLADAVEPVAGDGFLEVAQA